MRVVSVILVVSALVLAGARLFTGIDYGRDSPAMYLVLKRAPNLQIERTEPAEHPVEDDIILDHDDPDLGYFWIYFRLMQAAPVLAGLMLLAAAALTAAGRIRARRLRA